MPASELAQRLALKTSAEPASVLAILSALAAASATTVTREEFAAFLLRHGPESSCIARACQDLPPLASYFHGAIDRDTAIRRLASQRPGSFLLRIATDRGKFAISYVVAAGPTTSRIEHSLIEPRWGEGEGGYVLLLDEHGKVLQPTISAAIDQDRRHFVYPVAPPALLAGAGSPPPFPMVRSTSAPEVAGPPTSPSLLPSRLHPSLSHSDTAPASLATTVGGGTAGGSNISPPCITPAEAGEISRLMMPFSDKLKKALAELVTDLLRASSYQYASISSSSVSTSSSSPMLGGKTGASGIGGAGSTAAASSSEDEDPLTQSQSSPSPSPGTSRGTGIASASASTASSNSSGNGSIIRRCDEELLLFLKSGTAALLSAEGSVSSRSSSPLASNAKAASGPAPSSSDRRKAFAFHSKQASLAVNNSSGSTGRFVQAAQHYAAACLHAIILRHADVATDSLIQVGLCLLAKAFLRKKKGENCFQDKAKAGAEKEVEAAAAAVPSKSSAFSAPSPSADAIAAAFCSLLNLPAKKWGALFNLGSSSAAAGANGDDDEDEDDDDDGSLLFPSGHHGLCKLREYSDACLRTTIVLSNHLDPGWRSEPLYRSYAGLFLVHSVLAEDATATATASSSAAAAAVVSGGSGGAGGGGSVLLAEQALKAHVNEAAKLKKEPLFSSASMAVSVAASNGAGMTA